MIKRTIFAVLKEHLSASEITLIVGPRQVGKTYLMILLKQYLESKQEKTAWYNLDIDADRRWFESQSVLVHRIELELGKKGGYVFIDEMQRKENAGLFLKGIYDMNLPYKFIVSGSGSLELKEKIHESLAGRKRVFEILPISFEEFADYKTDYKYENKLKEFFRSDQTSTKRLFEEYMSFGGYPRVVLAETIDEKRNVIGEIVSSYIEKDLQILLKIEKSEVVSHLMRLLASQTGQLTNRRELSSSLGIADQTIKTYLWYLEKTFMVFRISPYFSRVKKTIIKQPKYYFHDLGLHNYMLGRFGNDDQNDGFQFENYVAAALYQKITADSGLYFWRTRDGAEVDFVITHGLDAVPIEAKYANYENRPIPRSVPQFIKNYKSKRGFIIHLGELKKKIIAEIPIGLLPYYDLSEIFEKK